MSRALTSITISLCLACACGCTSAPKWSSTGLRKSESKSGSSLAAKSKDNKRDSAARSAAERDSADDALAGGTTAEKGGSDKDSWATAEKSGGKSKKGPQSASDRKTPENPSNPFGENWGEIEESSLTDLLRDGSKYEQQERFEQARRSYEMVLDKDPNHGEAHHRLAVIADRARDYAGAEKHYAAAIRRAPNDASLLSDMGYSQLLRGNLPQSETYLKQAIEVDPNHRMALLNLGLVQGQQGRFHEALSSFRRAGSESEAQQNFAQLFPAAVGILAQSPPTETRPANAGLANVGPIGGGVGRQQGQLPQNMTAGPSGNLENGWPGTLSQSAPANSRMAMAAPGFAPEVANRRPTGTGSLPVWNGVGGNAQQNSARADAQTNMANSGGERGSAGGGQEWNGAAQNQISQSAWGQADTMTNTGQIKPAGGSVNAAGRSAAEAGMNWGPIADDASQMAAQMAMGVGAGSPFAALEPGQRAGTRFSAEEMKALSHLEGRDQVPLESLRTNGAEYGQAGRYEMPADQVPQPNHLRSGRWEQNAPATGSVAGPMGSQSANPAMQGFGNSGNSGGNVGGNRNEMANNQPAGGFANQPGGGNVAWGQPSINPGSPSINFGPNAQGRPPTGQMNAAAQMNRKQRPDQAGLAQSGGNSSASADNLAGADAVSPWEDPTWNQLQSASHQEVPWGNGFEDTHQPTSTMTPDTQTNSFGAPAGNPSDRMDGQSRLPEIRPGTNGGISMATGPSGAGAPLWNGGAGADQFQPAGVGGSVPANAPNTPDGRVRWPARPSTPNAKTPPAWPFAPRK